jgi:hypothetical protein
MTYHVALGDDSAGLLYAIGSNIENPSLEGKLGGDYLPFGHSRLVVPLGSMLGEWVVLGRNSCRHRRSL